MGVFEKIPPVGTATSQQLAVATGSELDFLQRILRMLSAMGLLKETDEDTYAHTPTSHIYTQTVAQASTKHLWDRGVFEMSKFPAYFEKYGYKSPTDHMNAPSTYAWGESNMDYFEVMRRNPPAYDIFNDAMSTTAVISAKAATGSFPFDQLSAQTDDGFVLIDVGGGKGQMIKMLHEAYPGIKGKFMLQDLKVVLDGGTVVPKDRVEVKPYDFLNQVQPVKGELEQLLW